MYEQDLFDFIRRSPVSYLAAASAGDLLEKNGYSRLLETDAWHLRAGGKYYVTKNGSSVIAFRIPVSSPVSIMCVASHLDSPCLRIKMNPQISDSRYARIAVECYGGMLMAPWLDRPLSVAGRIAVRTDEGVQSMMVDLEEPCLVIPNVAIHMNRSANDGVKINPAVDLVPVAGTASVAGNLMRMVAAKAGVSEDDIIGKDLFVYNPQAGVRIGDMICAPRLDDLQCAYGSLRAFLESGADPENSSAIPVCCLFDNEEVGSETKQGARSTFLFDTFSRIFDGLGLDSETARAVTASSFLVSADNAHAIHPNHPEYADAGNAPVLNGGIVIKEHAGQAYISDGVSVALFKRVCELAGVPTQGFANRSDLPSGATLGRIASESFSVNGVDIGLPQLAMHSCYETAGAKDTDYLIEALTCFYKKSFRPDGKGSYTVV